MDVFVSELKQTRTISELSNLTFRLECIHLYVFVENWLQDPPKDPAITVREMTQWLKPILLHLHIHNNCL